MAHKREKEESRSIACYLCHDGSVADTEISLESLVIRSDSFPNKLFTIDAGQNLPGLPERECLEGVPPLVTFRKRETYADVLNSFGDSIGQAIIVCEACCTEHEKNKSLENALQAEFDRRLTRRYEWLCRSLLDHNLLRLDNEALEQFVKKHGASVTCQRWIATLQEIQSVAPHEYIQEVRQRLAPVLAALTHVGKGALKIV